MRLVDLTLVVSEGMPVYPGDPEVRFSSKESGGFWVSEVCLGSHSGTHVDVPRHVNPQGTGVDGIPLDRLSGYGRAIDVRGQREVDLEEVPRAEVILFYTGATEDLAEAMKGAHPVLTVRTAEKLVKAGVKVVGVDSPSVGSLEVHRVLLESGVVIVENLSPRLGELLGKEFFFIVAPLPLKGLDGAPARAIALLME